MSVSADAPAAVRFVAHAADRLALYRRFVAEARGYRRHAFACIAGALSVLAFAPFFLFPVMFFTLPVLVWLIDGAGGGRDGLRVAAFSGWWFGFGFFFAGLFWIGEAFLVESEVYGWALPFAVTLMPAGLALFWAGAAAVARLTWSRGADRILVLALALAGAEWLRGHVLTGFPWNVLGYALTYPLVLMQSAGLLGIYGLSLWAVAIFAAPLVLAADAEPGRFLKGLARGSAVALLPLAALLAYGAVRLMGGPVPTVAGIKLRIVQASVPQREKWKPENQGPIFRDQLDLSRHNAAGEVDDLAGITHVIWPEAAMPFLPLEHPEAIEAIGELLPPGTFLLSGGLRREQVPGATDAGGATMRAFNSLMLFGHTGGVVAIYDKVHLVPFGEYLPLQPVLESLGLRQLTHMRGGFTAGAGQQAPMQAGALTQLAGLICYEAIFPGQVSVSPRPDLIVNVTNDGWFGNTTGPRQHFHQARVRAVELGLPLVRAANNGISALIDPFGRIIAYIDLNRRGVADSSVPTAVHLPPYGRMGDFIFLFNVIIFVVGTASLRHMAPADA